MSNILVKNIIFEGSSCDILLQNGNFVAIKSRIDAPLDSEIMDGKGAILLPTFTDCHMHLDKTLVGGPWQSNQAAPNLMGRIEDERSKRGEYQHDPVKNGRALLKQITAFGTTALRSHIDIDHTIGTKHLENIMALREESREVVDIELIAFPQSGILNSPGTEKYLEEALQMGCDGIGGLDPVLFDRDPVKHLDIIFNLADKYNAKVDIHLHEPGDIGAFSIELIAERTAALGLQGRVTISHAFCLGMVNERRLDQLTASLHKEQISIVTSAPGSAVLPPVQALCDAGVLIAGGSDNIRDFWSPYGSGDMLERAMFIGYRSNFRRDNEIELALSLCTSKAARLIGHESPEVAVGKPANFLLVSAENIPHAVMSHPVRDKVFKNGRLIAQNGISLW